MSYRAPNRWTANQVEKLEDRLGQLEKVVGAQNKIVAELRRSNRMLADAVSTLVAERSPDPPGVDD